MFPILPLVGALPYVPGNDSYTKLLLHGDGTDGATTFTDSSSLNHTMTRSGQTQIDTAKKKFGSASILFDGASDYLYASDTTNFTFGTGDWTVDFWMWLNTIGSPTCPLDFRSAGVNTQQGIYIYNTTNYFQVFANGANRITAANNTAVTGAWQHIALVRSSGTTTLYVDGVSVGSYSDSQNYSCPANRPIIGAGGYTLGAWGLDGWIDEFRISKGIARWTANFTPPTKNYG